MSWINIIYGNENNNNEYIVNGYNDNEYSDKQYSDNISVGLNNNTFYFNGIIGDIHSLNMSSPLMDSFSLSLILNDNNYSKENNNILATNNHIKENKENQTNNEKSTNCLTQKNKKVLPDFYSIFQILEKINNDEIKKKINDGKIEKSNEYKFMESLDRKWKKGEKVYNYHYFDGLKIENIGEKKRGRKPQLNCPIIEHTRMAGDNIIKKIKSISIKNAIGFLNQLFRKLNKNIQLLKLDFRYSKQLKREVDFNLLEKKLKDLASLDITSKFKNFKAYYNKEIIEKIENKDESIIEKTNENLYDTLMFVFKLTFRNWLDLITGKKNFEDFAFYYEGNGFINFDLIRNNFVDINQILENMEEDEKYLAKFVFYFYNYERWFTLKAGRNIKKK